MKCRTFLSYSSEVFLLFTCKFENFKRKKLENVEILNKEFSRIKTFSYFKYTKVDIS